MRCVIPGHGVKLFGRAILFLSKIGDELYIEALGNQMSLRTVNSSRSAFASFSFSQDFFIEYTQLTNNQSSSHGDTIKCKLLIRACLGVFKSLNTIDKLVESCTIEYNHNDVNMIFTLACRHGITKTYNLSVQDCERLQAVFERECHPNVIVAPAKTLLDSVGNFPNNCDEISVVVNPNGVLFKNYTEDEKDPAKVVQTEMTLVPDEFDRYEIGIDCEVTFCLKELRAVLAFSEFANQPLKLSFESGGKPIVFSLDGDASYTADLVLATLVDDNVSQAPSQQRPTNNSVQASQSSFVVNDCESQTNGTLATDKDHPINGQANNDDFYTDSFPYKELFAGSTSHPGSSSTILEKENQNLNTASPQIGAGVSTPNYRGNQSRQIGSDYDDDHDAVVGTPPIKKFKSIFFEDNAATPRGNVEVLAPNTDDEEDTIGD